MGRALLAAMPASAADIQANEKIGVDFYEKALNQKDFEAGLALSSP